VGVIHQEPGPLDAIQNGLRDVVQIRAVAGLDQEPPALLCRLPARPAVDREDVHADNKSTVPRRDIHVHAVTSRPYHPFIATGCGRGDQPVLPRPGPSFRDRSTGDPDSTVLDHLQPDPFELRRPRPVKGQGQGAQLQGTRGPDDGMVDHDSDRSA